MKMFIIERGERLLTVDDEDARLVIDSGSLRPEPRGFAPDQMVRCEACLRANSPTRTSCLYCASQLPSTEANSALQKPTLRPLEKWEQGFNVILVPGSMTPVTREILEEAAQLLRLDAEDLRKLTVTQEELPIALASTAEEASLIERRLEEMGVTVFVIADRDLNMEEKATGRARTFELSDDALVIYPAGGGEAARVLWNEIRLLVAGRLFVREIEVEERKGRSAENELLDAREMSTDEAVLDIYTAKAPDHFRIIASNFDFSCLGPRKNLVAAQNFLTLIGVLRERARDAQFDDSYNHARHALACVWPLEHETESRGWRRKRPGQISTEAVTRISNESQFSRYSRLRSYLQRHRPGLKT
jgi:hypothetical protein